MKILTSSLLFLTACSIAPSVAPDDVFLQDGEVAELIARGRDQLAADRVPQALESFEAAARLDDDSFRTRFWTLRGLIADRRLNDALDGIDQLSREHPSPKLDYLYGMAFAYKAQGYLESGVTDSSVGMHFQDATHLLKRVTASEDGERFDDAWLALALCAWYAQPPELEVARHAGERAVLAFPGNPKAWYQLGRVAFSQYTVAQADEARKAEALSHWERTVAAMKTTIDLSAGDVPLAADTWKQLGDVYAWESKLDEAAAAYAEAMGRMPELVDLGQIRSSLRGDETLVASIERGLEVFEELRGTSPCLTGDASQADMLWWLGFANFQLDRFEASEAGFQRCLALRPDYANSWFYVAHGRYSREDFGGAAEAFRAYWEADPAGMVSYVNANAEFNLPILKFLTDWVYRLQDLEGAGELAEAVAESAQDDPLWWNNLGLFLRDLSDRMERSGPSRDDAVLDDLHERAYAAYLRALDLRPENPAYLNDTAVMLHYYLERDYDQALAWYEKAAELSEKELERPDLSEDLREIYRIAKRDANDNLGKLRRKIERQHEAETSDA